jgi:hypothetical protein
VEEGGIPVFLARLLLHQDLGHKDQGLGKPGKSMEKRQVIYPSLLILVVEI